MTESTNSQLEFYHDPSLFVFLQEGCDLNNNFPHDWGVNSDEQRFIELVQSENSNDEVVTRHHKRRSGGTLLLCAMAMYYHMCGYRVALSTQNNTRMEHLCRSFADIKVENVEPLFERNRSSVSLQSTLTNVTGEHDIRLLAIGRHRDNDYGRIFKGLNFDYVFMDYVPLSDISDIRNHVLARTDRKLVMNLESM